MCEPWVAAGFASEVVEWVDVPGDGSGGASCGAGLQPQQHISTSQASRRRGHAAQPRADGQRRDRWIRLIFTSLSLSAGLSPRPVQSIAALWPSRRDAVCRPGPSRPSAATFPQVKSPRSGELRARAEKFLGDLFLPPTPAFGECYASLDPLCSLPPREANPMKREGGISAVSLEGSWQRQGLFRFCR